MQGDGVGWGSEGGTEAWPSAGGGAGQVPARGDGGEGEGDLGDGVVVTDALAGTGTEGDERLVRIGRPVRVEGESGTAVRRVRSMGEVDEVGAVQDRGSGRDEVVAELGVPGGAAGEQPATRVA